MEQTALKPGMPPQGPSTGIQELNPGPPRPAAEPKPPALRVLEAVADLRITVFLFALAMIIVFWGTLAQTDNGVWTVVNKYFRSFYVWVPLKVVCFNAINDTKNAIPFPGGWLIGAAMFANLLAAHAVRFKVSWGRSGIFLIHAGIIVMMVGELITGIYAIEGSIVIPVGQSSNTVIHPRESELAIVRSVKDNPKKDDVVTIPSRFLTPGAAIEHPEVPFKIQVVEYMTNSKLLIRKNTKATRGFGKEHLAVEEPEVSGVDPNQRHDTPSAYLKLTSRDGADLGTWLFSTHPGADVQWIKLEKDGEPFQVALRFKQQTRDFTFHLTKFTHDVYPGTNTPKDFHSYITILDPLEKEDRKVEIYMNAPLYYRGETFYQQSWTTDFEGKANGTVLQVVRNPGWLLPYLSCGIVGFGMLIHFGLTLYRFVDRRIVR